MKHEMYDQNFEPATALDAEGARVGLATCKRCGASVTIDPRDTVNYLRRHHEWHAALDAAIDAACKGVA